jgi:hypothetical protein
MQKTSSSGKSSRYQAGSGVILAKTTSRPIIRPRTVILTADESEEMEIVNYWLDWTMSLSQLFNHDDYDQRTAMITDLRKHVNGDFDASQLLKRLNTVQKPFSADHWRFSSPAVMFGAAILIAVVTFAIGKKCCAQAQVTAPTQNQTFKFSKPTAPVLIYT